MAESGRHVASSHEEASGPLGRLGRPDGKCAAGEIHLDMPWTVYILKSDETVRYYKGSCEEIEKRLANHNSGKVKSTKAFKPWSLHYSEVFESKSDALKRERFFKTRSGYRWLKSENII
jgi:putative endonuclease